jgi:putative ABC transport system permease protein
MFRNYIRVAIRNLWKNKTYSFINVFGLTLGLACFLLIALYVFDELTFDRFHANTNHIYRLVETKQSPQGKESKIASVSYKLSEQAIATIPEVKKAVRLAAFGRTNVSDPAGTNVFYESFLTANPEFTQVFDFKFLEGDRETALKAPGSVLITEEMALKLYNARSVVGRTLRTDRDSTPYTVTGVLENFPSNSHLSFNLIFSESSLTGDGYQRFIASDWSSNTFPTYVLLDKKADPRVASEKINQLVASHRTGAEAKSEFTLQPLSAVHFHSAGIEGTANERKGNLSYIYVFSIVAIFVLLIACINYMNLTTARFASRGKEIAVRKVAGADRRNLVTQFLSEAFIMAVISLVLAIIATWLLLPAFNQFTQKDLNLNIQTDYRIWIGVFATVVIVGLFAGAYPAFFQSRLKPYLLLKSKIRQGKGQLSLRRGLVVFQFSLSIIMIIATIIVFMQMKYVNTANMGFNKEQLLVVDINSGLVRRSAEAIKSEYSALPAVKSVSVTSRVPGEWKIIPRVKVGKKGAGTGMSDMYLMAADDQFLKTFEIRLIKGRNFSNGPADSSAILINESAAAILGITEPSEQLVEIPSVDFNGNVNTFDQPFQARVVGITKDFNFRSLREKISPMVIAYRDNPVHNIDYFTVRLNTENVRSTLKDLENILHAKDPKHLFEYNFLDQQWDNFYREDQKRQAIFLVIAILTILIACLGLFGLATYAAEQRIKEIGIRKVLGASVTNLMAMLSRDFTGLVLIAAVIAVPVSWWMMNSWLNDFAYRTKIYWWVFVLAGGLAFIIALLTVGFKAMKAALVNPVKSLRTE